MFRINFVSNLVNLASKPNSF